MTFSNCCGSLKRPSVTTGTVISTGAAVGDCPIAPPPNCWFCLAIAPWMSVGVMPSAAMRSGRSHTRIALSAAPNSDAWLAPGTRFTASRTYRFA